MAEPLYGPQKTDSHESRAQQLLHWARCHPGVLVVGSLAVANLLARSTARPEPEPPPPPQTEADFVDGETPLFI
jgi:hypothetical protein